MESRHAVSLMDMGPEDTAETCLFACPQSCRPSPQAEPAAWWKRGIERPSLPAAGPVSGRSLQLVPHPPLSLLCALHAETCSSGIWRAEARG